MKKKILILILSAVMVLSMTACGKNTTEGTETTVSENELTETSVDARTDNSEKTDEDETVPDYEAMYEPILNRYIDLILSGKGFEEEYEDDEVAVLEMASGYGVNELMNKVGYAYLDLTGNGVPELVMGPILEEETETYITPVMSIFCLDGNEARLMIRGWSRNYLAILEDNTIYAEGSNGAMLPVVGHYRPTGTGELETIDFYFGYENPDDPTQFAIYRNNIAAIDINQSMICSASDMYALEEECASKIKKIDYYSLASIAKDRLYAETSKVNMEWVKLPEITEDYGVISPWDGENGIKFTFDQPVKQVCFYAIEWDTEGNVSNRELAYMWESVTADSPVYVGLTLIGLLPNNMISYIDVDGKTYYYGITESGEDGSLILVDLGLN